MKSLPLQSHHYLYLEKAYREYLQTLGYAGATVSKWPHHLREFLHYLETVGVQSIADVTAGHITGFAAHIKVRRNRRGDGSGLSANHINTILNSVAVFARFLSTTGGHHLDITTEREAAEDTERSILTVAEIRQLYEATFLPHRENGQAMGGRDRAILAVFYGCGLRRSEGRALNLGDINFENKTLFVRRGKGGWQRHVPIAKRHLEDIKDYLEGGRAWFLHDHANPYHHRTNGRAHTKKGSGDAAAFFLSQRGGRMQTFYGRLQRMGERAGVEKPITLHGLRHSIATHLLEGGMDIEAIARFLGHASLASTQLYTHILNEHENGGL